MNYFVIFVNILCFFLMLLIGEPLIAALYLTSAAAMLCVEIELFPRIAAVIGILSSLTAVILILVNLL